MNQGDLGALYTTNSKDVWRLIGYASEPTAILQNLETKQEVGGAVGSLILADFKKLVVKEKE